MNAGDHLGRGDRQLPLAPVVDDHVVRGLQRVGPIDDRGNRFHVVSSIGIGDQILKCAERRRRDRAHHLSRIFGDCRLHPVVISNPTADDAQALVGIRRRTGAGSAGGKQNQPRPFAGASSENSARTNSCRFFESSTTFTEC